MQKLRLKDIEMLIDDNRYAFQLMQQISPHPKFTWKNEDKLLNAVGWTNNTYDKKYLLFIDYDNNYISSKTKAIIKTMSNDYGSFYFVKTDNGYHIVNFAKLEWSEYVMSLGYLVWNGIEDMMHFLISVGRKISVLRLNDSFKLEYAILNTPKLRYELSRPHVILFSTIFGKIPELEMEQLDKGKKVMFDLYHRWRDAK